MAFELRISSWDIPKICTLFKDNDSYIIAKERGKINHTEHVHIYLQTSTKIETFRNALKKNWKGLYKLSLVKNKEKYLKYISKDTSENNPWIQVGINEDQEEWKRFWLEDGEHLLSKGRNKLTSKIIDEMDELLWDTNFGRNTIDICIKINGTFPQKPYLNSLIQTFLWRNIYDNDQKDQAFNKCYEPLIALEFEEEGGYELT